MDNKIKLLVIGLGVLAAISLLIAFQLNVTNTKLRARQAAIQQELSQAVQENENLVKKVSQTIENSRSLSNALNEAEAKAKTLQNEISILKERLDITSGERESFLEKIQTLINDKNKVQLELEQAQAKKTTQEEKQSGSPSISDPTSAKEAYWADVLRQKASLELELESIKSQLKEITYKADELFKEKNALQMEFKSLDQEKEDLVRRAAYNEKLASALSEDLVREKSDKQALIDQLEKVKDDSRQMSVRIKDLEDTKTTLYKKIDNLEQERKSLENKIRGTETNLNEKVNEIVQMKRDFEKFEVQRKTGSTSGTRTVELSPIVVHGKDEVVKPSLTGRVLSFNKDNKFIVIDLGESQGVKLNDKFGIYRDNEYLGNVEVIQLRKDISAADIKDLTVGQEVKIGDIAKLLTN